MNENKFGTFPTLGEIKSALAKAPPEWDGLSVVSTVNFGFADAEGKWVGYMDLVDGELKVVKW